MSVRYDGGPRDFIHLDQVVLSSAAGEDAILLEEVTALFDTSGGDVVISFALVGGQCVTIGLKSTTTYAIAMALLRRRRWLMRGRPARPTPAPRRSSWRESGPPDSPSSPRS